MASFDDIFIESNDSSPNSRITSRRGRGRGGKKNNFRTNERNNNYKQRGQGRMNYNRQRVNTDEQYCAMFVGVNPQNMEPISRIIRKQDISSYYLFEQKNISNVFSGWPIIYQTRDSEFAAQKTMDALKNRELAQRTVEAITEKINIIEKGGYDMTAFIDCRWKDDKVGCGIQFEEKGQEKILFIGLRYPQNQDIDNKRIQLYTLFFVFFVLAKKFQGKNIGIFTNSNYLIQLARSGKKWADTGLKNKQGNELKNVDLLLPILREMGYYDSLKESDDRIRNFPSITYIGKEYNRPALKAALFAQNHSWNEDEKFVIIDEGVMAGMLSQEDKQTDSIQEFSMDFPNI